MLVLVMAAQSLLSLHWHWLTLLSTRYLIAQIVTSYTQSDLISQTKHHSPMIHPNSVTKYSMVHALKIHSNTCKIRRPISIDSSCCLTLHNVLTFTCVSRAELSVQKPEKSRVEMTWKRGFHVQSKRRDNFKLTLEVSKRTWKFV